MDFFGWFPAPGTPFAARIRWCVHRQGDRPRRGVAVADETDVGVKRLLVLRLTPSELHLEPGTPPQIQFERA